MSHYSRELHLMLKKTMSRAYRIHTQSKLGGNTGRLDFLGLEILSMLQVQPMSLKELTRDSELSRVDLQKYVTYLLKSGYISKDINVDDKRSIWLQITELGRVQLKGSIDQLAAPLNFALSDLTLNEEKAVLKYLSRLHQGLKQLEEDFEKPLK